MSHQKTDQQKHPKVAVNRHFQARIESISLVFTRTRLLTIILRYVLVFAIANPSVVCNVRAPYSGGWIFRQYFFAILYVSHPLTSVQNFTEIIPEEPRRRGGGVKHKRVGKIERCHVRVSHLPMKFLVKRLTLWSPISRVVTHGHPGLTYHFNLWHSGSLALSPERQSARMSEVKNGGLGLYGAEHSNIYNLSLIHISEPTRPY